MLPFGQNPSKIKLNESECSTFWKRPNYEDFSRFHSSWHHCVVLTPPLLCSAWYPGPLLFFSVYPYISKILHLEKKTWLWCQEAKDVQNELVFWLKRQNSELLLDSKRFGLWSLLDFFEVRILTLILRKKSEFWLNLELQKFLTLSQNSERNQEFRD